MAGHLVGHAGNYGFRTTRLRLSLGFLPFNLGGRVVDLASGDGSFTVMLTHRFQAIEQLVSIDVSSAALNGQAGSSGDSFSDLRDFVVADMRHIPIRNESVDYCIALEAIEHVTKADGKAVLREIGRIENRKGQLLLSTPNRFSLTSHTGRLLYIFLGREWTTGDPSHLYIYSAREIEKVVEEGGYRVVSLGGYYFLPAGMFPVDRALLHNRLYGAILSAMITNGPTSMLFAHITVLLAHKKAGFQSAASYDQKKVSSS